jgi:phosphoribosylglycinamide formyltransferase-1
MPGDDEESLSARILEQEHALLPEAVRAFAQGRLRVEGRRVLWREGSE